MSESQFEILYRQIDQMHLEWTEAMKSINTKVSIMLKSLKSCQSHCHVKNANEIGTNYKSEKTKS